MFKGFFSFKKEPKQLKNLNEGRTFASEVNKILQKVEVNVVKDYKHAYCLNLHPGEQIYPPNKLYLIDHVFSKIHLKSGKTINFDICVQIMIRDAKRLNLDIDYSKLEELNNEL